MSKPGAVIAGEVKACAAAGVEAMVDGEPAKHIHLVPMGEFTARDGRRCILADAAHAQQVIDATKAYAGRQDILVDYDHQSVFATKPDVAGRAIAAGWVKPDSLEIREDGIWASVDWTGAGEGHLRAKEYRYVSPYFGSDKTTRRVTRVFNAALTNTPALEELAAVASVTGATPSMEQICQALSLPNDASIDQIVAAINTLREGSETMSVHLKGAAKALGLAETAKGEELVVAATAKAAAAFDPARFVPRETYDALHTRFAGKEASDTEVRATAAVDLAISSGKVVPANRDWALSYAKADLAGFEAFAGKQPAVISETTTTAAAKPGAAKAALAPSEEAVIGLMGLSREQFLKSKKG